VTFGTTAGPGEGRRLPAGEAFSAGVWNQEISGLPGRTRLAAASALREVLEGGSPRPLWGRKHRRQGPGRAPAASAGACLRGQSESARGLAHSKTLRELVRHLRNPQGLGLRQEALSQSRSGPGKRVSRISTPLSGAGYACGSPGPSRQSESGVAAMLCHCTPRRSANSRVLGCCELSPTGAAPEGEAEQAETGEGGVVPRFRHGRIDVVRQL